MNDLKTNKNVLNLIFIFVIVTFSFSCQNSLNEQDLTGGDNDGDGIGTYYDVDEITLISPLTNSTVDSVTPTLSVYKFDPETVSTYYIQINTVSDFSGTMIVDKNDYPSNECIIPSGKLLDRQSYYWRAKAYDGEKWSDYWGGPWGFDVFTGTESTVSPESFESIDDTTPFLDWSDIAGATGYRILLYNNSDLETAIVDDSTLAVSQYQVTTPLLLNNEYMWEVIPKNEDGVYGEYSSTYYFYTSEFTSPKNPTPENNGIIYVTSPTFDWDDVDKATYYHIQVNTSSDFTGTTIEDNSSLEDSQYPMTTSLSYDETYYWRIKPGNEDGVWGYWGSTWSFTTSELDAPSAPVPENNGIIYITTPMLYWDDIDEAAGYQIQVSTSGNFNSSEIFEENTVTASQYQITTQLSYDETYYWRIRAKNEESIWQSWGSVWNFTPSQLTHFPADGSYAYSSTPILNWESISSRYRIQLNTESDFTGTEICDTTLSLPRYSVRTTLADETTYYWRILTMNSAGDWEESWCDTFYFTTRQPVEHIIDSDYENPSHIQAVDIDGDGDIDILGSSTHEKITWWENDGNQSFTEKIVFEYSNTIYGSLGGWSSYAVDIDSDDNMDIIGSIGSSGFSWFQNDGSQNFSKNSIESFDPDSIYSIDINNNGYMDILGASNDSSEIAMWENDGNQNFTKTSITSSFEGANSVYAADIDNDGDIDIFGAAGVADEIALWYNDSQGFTKESIASSFEGATSVYAVDMDNDGDLDILGAASSDGIICWYNDGNESFTEQAIDESQVLALSLYATDVNSDGNIDILTTTMSGDVFLYENDGNQNFTKHCISNSCDNARSIHAADIDNDGDLDILSAPHSNNSILWWEMEY